MSTTKERTPPVRQVTTIDRGIRRARKIQFAYPGGKCRIAPWLVQMMPRAGRIYLEPFVGRGNVYFTAAHHLNFERWWLNDIATAPFFNKLMETGGIVDVPPRTREEYAKYKQLYLDGDADAILLEPYFTYSGGGYRNGGFASGNGASQENYRRTLMDAARSLGGREVRITAKDWQLLPLDTLTEEDFVYYDPPYIGGDVRAYKSTVDHEALVKHLNAARFRWMLSEYEQPLYVSAFGEPIRREVQLACDGGRGRRRRVECVWTNF